MIIFSSVTKQFGDNPPALDDVSFAIEPGELAVVTGPSGSGKTSLMRLLTKEYHPTSGEISFLDVPLSEIRQSEIHHHRRKIGVVFQDYKLLHDLNVWENIALALSIIGAPTHEIESRVTDLLKLVNLVDKAFLFPNQLSGGEAQRVSIARALSTAPKMIFADEPTGNLDPDTSRSIIHLLQKINELGTTIIITTHDPVVLETLGKTRHLKLDQGKLVHDSGNSTKKKSGSPRPTENLDDEPDIPTTSHQHITVEVSNLDANEPAHHPPTHPKHSTPKETKPSSNSSVNPETEASSAPKTRVSFKLPKLSLPFGKKSNPEEKSSTKSTKESQKESDHE